MSRRPLLLAALVLAATLVGYGITRLVLAPPPASPAPAEQLAWLAREFRLTPAQAAEVSRLQAAYAPICEAHCAAVIATREALDSAATPEDRASVQAELSRLEKVCADATRAHLRTVADALPADQSARFLSMMEPRIAHAEDRVGAPSLAPSPAP